MTYPPLRGCFGSASKTDRPHWVDSRHSRVNTKRRLVVTRRTRRMMISLGTRDRTRNVRCSISTGDCCHCYWVLMRMATRNGGRARPVHSRQRSASENIRPARLPASPHTAFVDAVVHGGRPRINNGGGSRPLPLRARRVPCLREIRGVYTIRRTHRLWVNSCDKADVPGRSNAADDRRSLSVKHRLRQPAFPRMYR